MRTVNAIRYITPLREGGSLPALVEADDGFKYVLKFKGAGHGTKALVSELLGGLIAKELGLRIPELVFINLDEAFGRTEGDEEIQDLLQSSRGLNMGLHFLSGAFTYDPVAVQIDTLTASKIVWLDAYITNIDRTVRNTNLLMWNKELWLIDNGASFYFHHSWTDWQKAALSPFTYAKDHLLLREASQLAEVDKEFKAILTDAVLDRIVDTLPAEWLDWAQDQESSEDIRKVYAQFMKTRRDHSDIFINEAQHARG